MSKRKIVLYRTQLREVLRIPDSVSIDAVLADQEPDRVQIVMSSDDPFWPPSTEDWDSEDGETRIIAFEQWRQLTQTEVPANVSL